MVSGHLKVELQIRFARSVQELSQLELEGGGVELSRDDEGKPVLICKCCHMHANPLSNARNGIISIPNTPQGLSQAKRHLLERSQGKMHRESLRQAALLNRTLSLNETAGLNCARLALDVVREHQSYLAYERRIAGAAAMGMEVGTRNYSAAFARVFVEGLYNTIVAAYQRLLTICDPATKRLPSFVLVADKATCGRQTGQIIGMILMVQGVK